MLSMTRFVPALMIACAALGPWPCFAGEPAATPAADALPLFAVQIRTGANWDSDKPVPEQRFFREHSANLQRLREAGRLVMGARYSDVGLIVLAAESEAEARAMMDEDPSFAAGTFRYEVHPFNVFYPGTVQVRPRRTSAAQ